MKIVIRSCIKQLSRIASKQVTALLIDIESINIDYLKCHLNVV